MPSLSVEALKAHLHIDGTEDDATLSALIEAAEDWLKSVGVAEENLSRPSVRQAVVLIVKQWFDAQIALEADGAVASIPSAARALIAPWREVLT